LAGGYISPGTENIVAKSFIKVVVAGRFSVQMTKKLSFMISLIDNGARPIS
jgi:hypothetical protein